MLKKSKFNNTWKCWFELSNEMFYHAQNTESNFLNMIMIFNEAEFTHSKLLDVLKNLNLMFQYDVPNWIMQQKYRIKHSKFDSAESNARTKRYKRCYDTQNAELNIASI